MCIALYHTDVQGANKSNIQIGDMENPTQTINLTEAQCEELVEIITQIKNNIADIRPDQKHKIQSDIKKLEDELSLEVRYKRRITAAVASLLNKMKEVTPLIGLQYNLPICLSRRLQNLVYDACLIKLNFQQLTPILIFFSVLASFNNVVESPQLGYDAASLMAETAKLRKLITKRGTLEIPRRKFSSTSRRPQKR